MKCLDKVWLFDEARVFNSLNARAISGWRSGKVVGKRPADNVEQRSLRRRAAVLRPEIACG